MITASALTPRCPHSSAIPSTAYAGAATTAKSTGAGSAAADGISAAAGYLALQWLGHCYGATKQERLRRLPGDDFTDDPVAVTSHAITINAPPDRIWPWLVQMGWHRGARYTAQWAGRLLFPANDPSADRIIPELQHLKVGDHIPDGPLRPSVSSPSSSFSRTSPRLAL